MLLVSLTEIKEQHPTPYKLMMPPQGSVQLPATSLDLLNRAYQLRIRAEGVFTGRVKSVSVSVHLLEDINVFQRPDYWLRRTPTSQTQ